MSEVDRVVEFIKTNGYHLIDEMPDAPKLTHPECDEVAERTGIIHTIVKGYFI
jgi:hypothetical protein